MSSGLCTFVLLWYDELSMLVCLMETVAFVANFIECYDLHQEINCCICTMFIPVIDVSCFVQYFVRPDDLGVVVHMHLQTEVCKTINLSILEDQKDSSNVLTLHVLAWMVDRFLS